MDGVQRITVNEPVGQIGDEGEALPDHGDRPSAVRSPSSLPSRLRAALPVWGITTPAWDGPRGWRWAGRHPSSGWGRGATVEHARGVLAGILSGADEGAGGSEGERQEVEGSRQFPGGKMMGGKGQQAS